MASVLFSTIGQAVGGPLGGAVGALVGGTVDRALFGRRRGGEARDIFVQSSAYGEPLPRVYGTSRQAGILIWADQARRARGGGKAGAGNGRALTASFALALSSGRIDGIGRIWADGREFRDGDGRFAVPATMRVHHGRADQAPDPLITAVEGMARTPAYRGLAYVVFENLPLGDFGNRLPNFSFELFADGAAGAETWLSDLARGARCAVVPVPEPQALGYVAQHARQREDLEVLARWIDAPPSYSEGRLRLGGEPRVHHISQAELGAHNGDGQAALPPVRSVAMEERPSGCDATYLDAARDYQRGLQSERRQRPGRDMVFEAPVVAEASMARAVARRILRTAEAGTETLDISLPIRWLHIGVGDVLTVEGMTRRWRVVRLVVEGMVVRLACAALPLASTVGSSPVEPGRSLPAPVQPVPASVIQGVELPMDPWESAAAPALWIGVSGAAGWAGAEVSVARVEGSDPVALGTMRGGSWSGWLDAPLAAGPVELWDELNSLVVRLDDEEATPESRVEPAVLAGANLVLVGEELVQFRRATALGGDRFKLEGLLRGRGATLVPAEGHPVGTRLMLVDRHLILRVPIGGDEIGLTYRVWAEGRGDPPGGTAADFAIAGAGRSPLAPCHLQAERLAGGAIRLAWTPRARGLIDWTAEDVAGPGPLRFECRINSGAVMTKMVLGSDYLWTVGEQVADLGAPAATFDLRVVAVGDGPLWLRASENRTFTL